MPLLAQFVYSQDSVQFALVSQSLGGRFDVDIVSVDGSYQDHATFEGAALSAAFVRRGAILEIDEASGTRAWMELAWTTQSPIAQAFVARLANAQALPSRHAVEAAAIALWTPIAANRQELAQVEVTPPFPSGSAVTFYCYAEALAGGESGPANGVPLSRDSSIFGALTASASHHALATVHDGFGEFALGSYQAGWIPATQVRAFERERDRLEATLVADVYAGRTPSDAVRASYCFWVSMHPLLAKALRARHGAFFAGLACNPR